MTPAEAIEAAELIEAETRYRNQVGRLMYEAGRRDAEAEMAAQWSRVTAVVRGPDLGELETRRWGPGGRAHFADPRPGDFPGRAGRREPEPEPELEAEIEGPNPTRSPPWPRSSRNCAASWRATRVRPATCGPGWRQTPARS
jgi:hypothetical protein